MVTEAVDEAVREYDQEGVATSTSPHTYGINVFPMIHISLFIGFRDRPNLLSLLCKPAESLSNTLSAIFLKD